jgi:hypothetical protein
MFNRVHKTFFILLVVGCFLPSLVSRADTLLISPSSGNYKVGQSFSVRIMVSSSQAVNAVSAVLAYPTDKLQVTSISKIGSILNLWVEEPSFSNTQGTVSMEGVVPNPGYVGAGGPVVTINFRVIEAGTATLRFSSGSLLANDGYGTNILRNRGTASLSLSPAPMAEPVVAPTTSEIAPEPEAIINLESVPKVEEKAEEAASEKVITFQAPSPDRVYELVVKFLSLTIPLIALVFFLIHTTKSGVGNLRTLRKNLRKDLHGIDRLVEKSFDLIREDLSDSIHMLERARTKRRLTSEEDAIILRLRQNLVDAEKIIQAEIAHAEKDLGD